MRDGRGRAMVAGLLLGSLVALLVAGPARAQERVEGNVYSNARYGVQLTKPAKWYFITAGTILDLARKAAGAPRSGTDEDPVKAAGFAVVVSKVPSLGRAFDPQVILVIQDLAQPSTDLGHACEGMRSGMTEPETVRPTRPVQLDGKPALRLDFQGLVDSSMVRATALCTLRDRRVYFVVGQAEQANFDGEAVTFETILSSFRLK